MKKYLVLIAAAITLGFTSCGEEDCNRKGITNVEETTSLVGSWYNEEMNEEDSYSANGTFYMKYSNVERSSEDEGRWEFDRANSRLTWTYSFMGQTQFGDWKVKQLSDLTLTISSDKNAEHTYGKIIKTYQLEVGKTAIINIASEYPNYSVSSYTSMNPRIANVQGDGTITAVGEKGTTYVKIKTNQGEAWAKVIVGDNCVDLWFDYVSVINQDYTSMANTFKSLGEPQVPDEGNDGYSFYFKHTNHDVIDQTNIFICQEDEKVTEIQLQLKPSVPETKILSYMNAHYYKLQDVVSSSIEYYSTLQARDSSKAIVAYDKTKKVVYLLETKHFFQTAHLWKGYTHLFGKDKNSIKNAMDEYGYSFLMSDDSYSENGSDYYSTSGNDYMNMIGFVFNPDNQMSEYWAYWKMSETSSMNTLIRRKILQELSSLYTEVPSEETSSTYVFYNQSKTLKIVMDLKNSAVVYTNTTMKQHVANTNIFGKYEEALGLTQEQVKAKFGNPYSADETDMTYIVGSNYVDFVFLSFNTETKKCKTSTLSINESVASSMVLEYFNSKYTVFEKGTTGDGSQYAWLNGTSLSESTLGIIYIPQNNMIIYQPLGSASNNAKVQMMNNVKASKKNVMFIGKK